MNVKMQEVALVAAVTVMLWYLVIYTAVSAIDKEHCEHYGVQYHSTSIGLTGYCSVSGKKVPAEAIGRD